MSRTLAPSSAIGHPQEQESRLRLLAFDVGVLRHHRRAVPRLAGVAGSVLFNSLLVAENPTVRGHRLGAVARFWRCQLLRRRGRSYEVTFADGNRLVGPPWSSLLAVTAAVGDHEPWEQAFVRAYIRPGDLTVDVGANLGFYSTLLLAAGAGVIAVEPSSAVRPWLTRNMTASGGAGFVIVAVALSDADGTGALTIGLDATNHLVHGAASGPVEQVPLRRLDDVVDEHAPLLGNGPVRFVKIDAEGEDERVLAGSVRTLAEHRPVVLVETRFGGGAIRDALGGHGYDCHWYDTETGSLRAYPRAWPGHGQFHTNMLAVHADTLPEVVDRLRRRPAPAVTGVRVEQAPG